MLDLLHGGGLDGGFLNDGILHDAVAWPIESIDLVALVVHILLMRDGDFQLLLYRMLRLGEAGPLNVAPDGLRDDRELILNVLRNIVLSRILDHGDFALEGLDGFLKLHLRYVGDLQHPILHDVLYFLFPLGRLPIMLLILIQDLVAGLHLLGQLHPLLLVRYAELRRYYNIED